MSDTDGSNDEMIWKMLAMQLASEMPPQRLTALRVLGYMADWLHHLYEMPEPITIETDHIVLQVNRKEKA